MLLPSPGWNGLHPLMIHFSITLLLLAPLFLLRGTVLRCERMKLFSDFGADPYAVRHSIFVHRFANGPCR